MKSLFKQALKTLPVNLENILHKVSNEPRLVLENNILDRLYKVLLVEQDERISNHVTLSYFVCHNIVDFGFY